MGTWGSHPMASDGALDTRDCFLDDVSARFGKIENVTPYWLAKYALSYADYAYVIAYTYYGLDFWPTDPTMLKIIKNCLNLSSWEQPKVDINYFYKDNGFRYPNGKTYDVLYLPKEMPITKFSDNNSLQKLLNTYISDDISQQEFIVQFYQLMQELVQHQNFLEKDLNIIIDNVNLFFKEKDERHAESFLELLDTCLDNYIDLCEPDCQIYNSYEEEEDCELPDFYKYIRDFYYHFEEVVAGSYKLASDPGLFAKMFGCSDPKVATTKYAQTIVYVDSPVEYDDYMENLETNFISLYKKNNISKDFIDCSYDDLFNSIEDMLMLQAKTFVIACKSLGVYDKRKKFDLDKEIQKEYKKRLKQNNLLN